MTGSSSNALFGPDNDVFNGAALLKSDVSGLKRYILQVTVLTTTRYCKIMTQRI